MDKSLILIGGGGHAKVVLDALMTLNEKSEKKRNILGYLDDATDKRSHSTFIQENILYLGIINNIPQILSKMNKFILDVEFFCCVGDNCARRTIINHVQQLCRQHYGETDLNKIWSSAIIHPKAVIMHGARVQMGTYIACGATIGVDTFIEDHCIINTNSSVDHDCSVSCFAHLLLVCIFVDLAPLVKRR